MTCEEYLWALLKMEANLFDSYESSSHARFFIVCEDDGSCGCLYMQHPQSDVLVECAGPFVSLV